MNPRHCLLVLLVLVLGACPANNTPQPSPPSPAPATGYEPPGTNEHPPVSQDPIDAGAAPVAVIDAGAPVVAAGPQPDGAPCGLCDSCLLRRKGFAGARLADPVAGAR